MASPRSTSLYAEGNASGNNEPDLTAAEDAVDRGPSPGPASNGRETPSQALSQQEPAPTAAAAAAGTKQKRPATDPNKKTVRFSWNAQQTAAVMEWLLVQGRKGFSPYKRGQTWPWRGDGCLNWQRRLGARRQLLTWWNRRLPTSITTRKSATWCGRAGLAKAAAVTYRNGRRSRR